MDEFPETVNDGLALLRPLHDVFTATQPNVSDQGGTDAGENRADPLQRLGENPGVKDLARLLIDNLGGRRGEERPGSSRQQHRRQHQGH